MRCDVYSWQQLKKFLVTFTVFSIRSSLFGHLDSVILTSLIYNIKKTRLIKPSFKNCPGVDFSTVSLNCVAVRPSFSHLFVAQKFGNLNVGRMAKFDRAISMTFAQRKSYKKSTPGMYAVCDSCITSSSIFAHPVCKCFGYDF